MDRGWEFRISSGTTRVPGPAGERLMAGHVNDVSVEAIQAAEWRMVSPDGTVLASGHGDCCP